MRLFLFFLLTYTVSCAVPSCPDGWSSFEGATKCFKLVTETGKQPLINAIRMCGTDTEGVASVHSDAESKFLATLGNGVVALSWTPADHTFFNFDKSPTDYIGAIWGRSLSAQDLHLPIGFVLTNSQWVPYSYVEKVKSAVFCQRPVAKKQEIPVNEEKPLNPEDVAIPENEENTAVGTCPYDFIIGTTKATKSFCYYGGFDATWDEAKSICRQKGAHMASIHSFEENEYIIDMFTSNEKFTDMSQQVWLGGYFYLAYNEWAWDDDSVMDFKYFGLGGQQEPPTCIAIQVEKDMTPIRRISKPLLTEVGKWFEYDCNQKMRSFICKTDATY